MMMYKNKDKERAYFELLDAHLALDRAIETAREHGITVHCGTCEKKPEGKKRKRTYPSVTFY